MIQTHQQHQQTMSSPSPNTNTNPITKTKTTKSPLHNFTLPPTLKWANQRQLRCTKPTFQPPNTNNDDNHNNNNDHNINNCETAPPTETPTGTAACTSSPGAGKRLRSNGFETRYRRRGVATGERVKFCVQLSKEEVDFDYLAMVGTKPPRKPKRRPRLLQRQIDMICPGLWLTEITADRYGVSDFGDFRKLKG